MILLRKEVYTGEADVHPWMLPAVKPMIGG